jgi:hypothetical protein
MAPLVVRFIIYGAILAFYLYYIGGCVFGPLLPRAANRGAPLPADVEREAPFLWGELGRDVRLLLELPALESEDPTFEERSWSDRLSVPDRSTRYGYLNVLHLEGDSVLDWDPQKVEVLLGDGDIRAVSPREVASGSLSRSGRALLGSQCPEAAVSIPVGSRLRILVSFRGSDLPGRAPSSGIVRIPGASVELRPGRAPESELARFLQRPGLAVPVAWLRDEPGDQG